jgi:hypothetical protein
MTPSGMNGFRDFHQIQIVTRSFGMLAAAKIAIGEAWACRGAGAGFIGTQIAYAWRVR